MVDIQTYKMLIDGEWVDALDGQNFACENPSNGDVWCHIPEATEKDVDRAVQAAHWAFKQGPWASMLPTQRGQCLRKLAEF